MSTVGIDDLDWPGWDPGQEDGRAGGDDSGGPGGPGEWVFPKGDHPGIAAGVLRQYGLFGEPGGTIVFSEDDYWVYSDGRWSVLPEQEVKKKIIMINDWAEQSDGRRFSVSKGFMDSVLHMTKILACDEMFFEHDIGVGVAFRNGFADVSSGSVVLRPTQPGDKVRHIIPVDYLPDAECPKWKSFLVDLFRDDIDRMEKIRFLGQFVGVALLGRSTDFNKALMLLGSGANGKSVLCDVVEQLFPEGSVSSVSPQDMSNSTRVSQLKGSFLNMVADIPTRDLLDAGAFKQVVAGDAMEGRFLYRNPFRFRSTAGHIFSANELPATADKTHGFFRRWIVLKFNRQFDDGEEETVPRNILVESLLSEKEGIARWCLEKGIEAMANRSFFKMSSHTVEIDQWQLEVDQVRAFLDSKVVSKFKPQRGDPGIRGSRLYEIYVKWAKENGVGVLSHSKLSRSLQNTHRVPFRPMAHGREWGLNLMTDAEISVEEGLIGEIEGSDDEF